MAVKIQQKGKIKRSKFKNSTSKSYHVCLITADISNLFTNTT